LQVRSSFQICSPYTCKEEQGVNTSLLKYANGTCIFYVTRKPTQFTNNDNILQQTVPMNLKNFTKLLIKRPLLPKMNTLICSCFNRLVHKHIFRTQPFEPAHLIHVSPGLLMDSSLSTHTKASENHAQLEISPMNRHCIDLHEPATNTYFKATSGFCSLYTILSPCVKTTNFCCITQDLIAIRKTFKPNKIWKIRNL
jgi:hypothetical protein